MLLRMRILISSHLFAPSIGGIEQVSGILAAEFSRVGHEVRVITETPANSEEPQPYAVFRKASRKVLFGLLNWCDAYLQSNISLATLWPALLRRKPTLIVHHTWISRPDGRQGWQDRAKLQATRWVRKNLAVSRALAASIPAECGIVPNPYRDDIFVEEPNVNRDRDLVFVGRLVSDKGADLLLAALGELAKVGRQPTATIVGSGPEEAALREQCRGLGLGKSVEFAGSRTGAALGALLNRHRVLVAPSRWQEPFGIVALEGLACGCAVIGSEGGGLADAIGPCGLTFPNGDVSALAGRISRLLTDETLRQQFRTHAGAHLARHHQRAVAEVYLQELSRLCTAP